MKPHGWVFCPDSPKYRRDTYHVPMNFCKFIGWFALWLGLALATSTVAAKPLELRQANAVMTVGSVTETVTVALPYAWDQWHVAQSGQAVFEMPFDLPTLPTELYGAYFSRIGTAYQVWVNDVLVASAGALNEPNGTDMAKAPRLVPIPHQVLRLHNVLRVTLRADANRRAGLSRVLVGPQAEVEIPYQQAYRKRVINSLVIGVISLCVAALAFWLWLTQPGLDAPAGRDPLYLFMGVNALAWAVRTSEGVIESPPLPWPAWGLFSAGAYVVWVAFTFLFCQQVLRPVSRRGWLLAGLCVASGLTAVSLALWSGQAWGWQVWSSWLGVLALWSVAYTGWFGWRTWGGRGTAGGAERLVIAAALLLATVAGIRELVDVSLSDDFYGESSVARYTSSLFGMAFVYIVASRFRSASKQSRDLTHHLALRIAQREDALAISYGELEQLAREQSSTAERVRILRDMHDGVGSHISTAIRQLESGRSMPGEVLHTLRDSLDQLKLSIDAMNLPPGDINALLANMRYRLEPRFLACNIPWHWQVNELAPITRLDDGGMRQMQFMLFEALSNVLQHAQASVVQIVAWPHHPNGQGVRLQIIDNGRGFDVAQAQRRGLLSMQERARAISATLTLNSVPGRSIVDITLE